MAFPVGLPPAFLTPGRTGIIIGIVPPAKDFVDIEIHAEKVGSTYGYTLLETIKAQLMNGGSYQFTYGLPLTTDRYHLKARSVGAGLGPSTFTNIISAKPARFGSQVYPTANQPVLGVELPVPVGPSAFTALSSTTRLTIGIGGVLPSVLGGTHSASAPVDLAPGLRITRFAASVQRTRAADAANIRLYEVSSSAGAVALALLSPGVSANRQSLSSTIGVTVVAGSRYAVEAQLKASSSAPGAVVTGAELFAATVYVMANNFTQGAV